MTQMGLDYQKHLEAKRHNIASESIDQQDADTREYTASFKPEEMKLKAQELKVKSRGDTLKALSGTELETIWGLTTNAALIYLIGEGIITAAEAGLIQKQGDPSDPRTPYPKTGNHTVDSMLQPNYASWQQEHVVARKEN